MSEPPAVPERATAREGGAQRVQLAGLLRGRELAGAALIVLDEEAIALATARGRVALALATLEGTRCTGAVLQLFVSGGDVVELRGSTELGALAGELARRVLVLPELTRSLRALGSSRRAPGEDHDRWFAPLLAARRAAEEAEHPDAVRDALDAAALRSAVARVVREVAAERYPDEPPERRALEAELLDGAAPLVARLDALASAQRALAECGEEERFARWRAWSRALQDAFAGADASWAAVAPVLAPERRGRRSRVSRWLWRRRGGR